MRLLVITSYSWIPLPGGYYVDESHVVQHPYVVNSDLELLEIVEKFKKEKTYIIHGVWTREHLVELYGEETAEMSLLSVFHEFMDRRQPRPAPLAERIIPICDEHKRLRDHVELAMLKYTLTHPRRKLNYD